MANLTTRQAQLNRAENILSECHDEMDGAIDVLLKLAEHDTEDHVFQQAKDALADAMDYVDDAISSVVDGFGIGDDDA